MFKVRSHSPRTQTQSPRNKTPRRTSTAPAVAQRMRPPTFQPISASNIKPLIDVKKFPPFLQPVRIEPKVRFVFLCSRFVTD